MLAGVITHPFFLYLFGFQKIIIYFRGGGGFQNVIPLKISQPPPPPENISTPPEKMSPRENMLTGTTTSLPIHFSSSLYLFFNFPKKNFRGGGVVEPPPPLNMPLLPTNHDCKKFHAHFVSYCLSFSLNELTN